MHIELVCFEISYFKEKGGVKSSMLLWGKVECQESSIKRSLYGNTIYSVNFYKEIRPSSVFKML